MPKLPKSRFFPPVESADDSGLLGLGGSLDAAWLLDAYGHGIFPWPVFGEEDPMAWWAPDPRAIVELDGLHVSGRLRRTLRGGRFQLTCDRDFAAVIRACATVGDRAGETWITPAIIDAYEQLHAMGHAHSVEAWQDGALAGGTYGVAIGGLFAAESKFHRVRDASKVGLAHLVAHLRRRGYRLLDIQQLTPHMARLGAMEIPRENYMARLAEALAEPVTFGEKLESQAALE